MKSQLEPSGGTESRLTVLLALGANLGVALLKLAAGLVSGSGALLSEAAHSAGDCSTELLLLTALTRSRRRADRRHPFGYGKERYFWSLLAAMAIFMSGAVFSFYEGLQTITEQSALRMVWVNYAVLLGAAVLETASLVQGLRQARSGAARRRTSLPSHIRDPDDPTVKSVILEDTAALIGLFFATVGVTLREVTGVAAYDGAASIAIGLLLVVTSVALARTCKSLLVGQQADAVLVRSIKQFFEARDDVVEVVDLLTMMVGVDRVLLCARVDFVPELTSDQLEESCVRIDEELRSRFPVLGEIFVEPVPRSDQRLRQRVLSRYGVGMTNPSVMADDR